MKRKHIFYISILLIILAGCGENIETEPFQHQESNSIYYWRTDFRLDSIERDFILKHDIRKMYIRFFDVVNEVNNPTVSLQPQYGILPNATITFTDPIPESVTQVVPTIYITIDALRRMKGKEADAASKIVRRTLNMISYNEVRNVSELQLDCDWTETTDSIYFNLCRAVRDTLNRIAKTPFTLSSTIRLHQLKKDAPPVDYGVLMCYNTGSFLNKHSRNSILDFKDVEPYFRRRINYPLHLDLALPIYDWTLCYRNNDFAGIIKTDSLFHSSYTKSIQEGTDLYKVTANDTMSLSNIEKGDILRHEKSDFQTIMRVTKLIDTHFTHKPQSIILYHLDSNNIKSFSDNEISQIYSRDNI